MATKQLAAILKGREGRPSELIETLHDIQAKYRYLPEDVLHTVAEKLAVPLIEVFRVANFYKAFYLKPPGRCLITVCKGTACHVRNAPRLVDEIRLQLNISPGETTRDRRFSFETVNCLGACALGPIVVINGRCHDHMSPSKIRKLIDSLRKPSRSGKKK